MHVATFWLVSVVNGISFVRVDFLFTSYRKGLEFISLHFSQPLPCPNAHHKLFSHPHTGISCNLSPGISQSQFLNPCLHMRSACPTNFSLLDSNSNAILCEENKPWISCTLSSSLSWGFTQHWLLVSYRSFGANYRSYLQGESSPRWDRKIVSKCR